MARPAAAVRRRCAAPLPVLLLCSAISAAADQHNPATRMLLGALGLRKGAPAEPQPLKVIVAGYSRTGTSSIKLALEALGYKTWHGEDLTAHEGHLDTCLRALTTEDAGSFLDALHRDGFNATCEYFHVPPLWRQAIARYPDARVILTVRDSEERLSASVAAFWPIVRHMLAYSLATFGGPIGWILHASGSDLPAFACAYLAWVQHGESVPGARAAACQSPESSAIFAADLDDIAAAFVAGYRRDNAALRAGVPPERFLEFNVKEGYAPLCRFLDVPPGRCPAEFPHANDAVQVSITRVVLAAIRFGWWAPLLLAALCARQCRCCRGGRQRKKPAAGGNRGRGHSGGAHARAEARAERRGGRAEATKQQAQAP